MENQVKTEHEGDAFDEAAYQDLRKYYFDPVVCHNEELPGGRVLRKTTKPPRIESKTPGFDKLRKQIKQLERAGDHVAIWHLLRQLSEFMRRPPALGGAAVPGASSEVTEVIEIDDDAVYHDVDSFICEVLLTKVTVVKSDPDGGTVTVERSAPEPFGPVVVKSEPEGEPASKKARTVAAEEHVAEEEADEPAAEEPVVEPAPAEEAAGAPVAEPFTNQSLRAAVDEYFEDKAAAERRYGKMGTWDVSRVTDMSRLFWNRTEFNDPGIGAWDTSSVDSMAGMFHNCRSFNSDISAWDTSSVTSLCYMFHSASLFNQDLRRWDLSSMKAYWNTHFLYGFTCPPPCMFTSARSFDPSNAPFPEDIYAWAEMLGPG